MKNRRLFLLLTIVFFIGAGFFYACKKVDLTRLAMVKTEEPTNITNNSVKARGDVIDLGEYSVVSHGFCWAEEKLPIVNVDESANFGEVNSTGSYSATIDGLRENTNYQLRSFMGTGGEFIYGDVFNFKTQGSTPPPQSEWIFYDDGSNHTGIGFSDERDFDVAIRFSPADLADLNGFKVTKIRFFPKGEAPTRYYITLWTGSEPPQLIYVQEVTGITADQWNEAIPEEFHTIDAGKYLWIGYWITDQPAGQHPAGTDNGPAIAGFGDMISIDDGATWESLYEANPDLNYNWNFQAYVTNEKGEEIQITRSMNVRKTSVQRGQNSGYVTSLEKSKQTSK